MSRFFYIITFAFHVWMLVDAIKRKAEWYWFLIIILIPFGDLIYFIAIKRHDLASSHGSNLPSKPKLLETARYDFETVPSVEHRLKLAQAFFAMKNHSEASGHFEQVLETHPNENEALYGLGLCRIALDDPQGALPPLEKLVSQCPGFRDYSAWPDLIAMYHHLALYREAESKMRELINHNSRPAHQLMFAELLRSWGRTVEARHTAEQALNDAQKPHGNSHSSNKDAVRKLKLLLKNLSKN